MAKVKENPTAGSVSVGSRPARNDSSKGQSEVPAVDTKALQNQDLEAYGNLQQEVQAFGGTTGDENQGCWASFSGCISGIWATRQLAKSKDREIYVKTTLRELIVYVFFLIILCFLTFGMMSTNMFYFTSFMNALFLDTPFSNNITFRTIGEVEDVWSFFNEVALQSLFPQKDYNDNNLKDIDKNILYENKLLGSPRLRQIRVKNDSCIIPYEFKKTITVCYDVYSPYMEDKQPFGLINGTEWSYSTESQINGSTHWGQLATYSGAGSYLDLGFENDEAQNNIQNLQKNLWISRGTRVVFLDFTVYNANINLFCIVKLVMEFAATGGVIPSWSFRTVKLIRYVTILDYCILSCEIIFCLFIIYYIVEETLEITKIKWPYFKSVWNILDVVVIFISLVCISFSVYRTINVEKMLSELLTSPYQFADFEFLGFWQTQYNNAVALSIFFAWIKIFKYISFNKTMTQLSATLSKCAKEVAGFAVMFFIVFSAFAQLGFLLFGTQMDDFADFQSSVFSLFRIILGNFNFHGIQQANRVLGPLFFVIYVFFVYFVLLNMFLAIINDTYSGVKSEIARQKNEFEIGDYFLRGYNNVLGRMGRRDKIIDLQAAIKLADSNYDGTMSFEEIRKHLKSQNYSDLEIEMFFSKYDKDANMELSVKETKKMIQDLHGEKVQLDKELEKAPKPNHIIPPSAIGHETNRVSYEQFSVLLRRVDHMEFSIGSIVSKIDAVLFRFDGVEQSKFKRREAMDKILDTIAEKEAEEAEKNQMEELVANQLHGIHGNGASAKLQK